jgi:hypothetical protein
MNSTMIIDFRVHSLTIIFIFYSCLIYFEVIVIIINLIVNSFQVFSFLFNDITLTFNIYHHFRILIPDYYMVNYFHFIN